MSIITVSNAIVDFNSVEEDGTIIAATRSLRGLAPALGDRLTLEDREGHTVWGVVEGVQADRVIARPRWETWASPSEEVFELGLSAGLTTHGAMAGSAAHTAVSEAGVTADSIWKLSLPREASKVAA